MPRESDQDGVAVLRGAQFDDLRLTSLKSSNLLVSPPPIAADKTDIGEARLKTEKKRKTKKRGNSRE